MIRLIVSDLDETLIRKDRTIHPDCVEAIKKLKEKNILFVPATGRGYRTVEDTLRELDLFEQEGQYVMSYNGGAITENKGNRMLFFHAMDDDLTQILFERGISQYHVAVRVYVKEAVYVFNITDEERAFATGRGKVIECDVNDLALLGGQPIVKIVYVNKDFAYLKKIEADLCDLHDRLDISYSSGRYMEFNPKGINKGEGMRKLAELLGIDMSETMAIGDNFNDLPMICAAAVGVGVANSIEGILPYCDHITEKTCEEGAVAEAIRRFCDL
ncbi:MAG: HAD family hydrolase [Solobacterium sp.]|nr:HAD family hydrolase [Solobacterium sp.]